MLDTLSKSDSRVTRLVHLPEEDSFGGQFLKDPLDADHPDDQRRSITDRQLVRLLVIAAHTATRFEREHSEVDPVAWMLASRRLFCGKAAIDACHELSAFTRAIVLHGLAIGLDADVQSIDDLLEHRSRVHH